LNSSELQGWSRCYDDKEVVVLIAYGELVNVGLDERIVACGQREGIPCGHAMDVAQALGVDGDISLLRSMTRRPLSHQ